MRPAVVELSRTATPCHIISRFVESRHPESSALSINETLRHQDMVDDLDDPV